MAQFDNEKPKPKKEALDQTKQCPECGMIHAKNEAECPECQYLYIDPTKELSVSPNPASDVIKISFNNANREKTTVRVIDASGKQVIESTTSNDFIHFDISNLPGGIYVAQVIRGGQATDTNKFIISH